MSREKQIEEMAKIIDKYGRGLVDYECRELAEALYNAEYRKQSEVVRCKDCEHFYQVGDVRICRHWNYHSTKDDAYCSCAKMKGGTE